jgi:hypothetical protein
MRKSIRVLRMEDLEHRLPLVGFEDGLGGERSSQVTLDDAGALVVCWCMAAVPLLPGLPPGSG